MPPEDYRDRLLRPPVYRPADQDVTVRISPADLDRLLAQAAQLTAALARLEDAAAQATPGSPGYEALDTQLDLLYQIAGPLDATSADIDSLPARVAALERVLVDVDGVLKRAQDACDLAEQPARAQDCYIARQQIAALFPPES